MITIATITHQTTAKPSAIFSLWQNINHWTDFDDSINWAKLNGDFAVGNHYRLKPKGSPVVKATIVVVEPNTRYIDRSDLIGATLSFDHDITQTDGSTVVSITQTLDGILAPLWAKVLKNQQAHLDKSTAKLTAIAEGQL